MPVDRDGGKGTDDPIPDPYRRPTEYTLFGPRPTLLRNGGHFLNGNHTYPSLVRNPRRPGTVDKHAQPFYSNIDNVLDTIPPKTPIARVVNILKAHGISNDEINFHPLGRAMEGQNLSDPKLTLHSVAPLNVYDSDTHAPVPRLWSNTSKRHEEYTSHGGTNYQAHLIRVGEPDKWPDYKAKSHWPEYPDDIAIHARFQDRRIPGYGTILEHLEAQSDWHKAWLNHQRYLKDPDKPGLRQYQDEVDPSPLGGHYAHMALKYALHHAAVNGYDGLMWTPGEHQAARYDVNGTIDGHGGYMHFGPDDEVIRQTPLTAYTGLKDIRKQPNNTRSVRPDIVAAMREKYGVDEDGWTRAPVRDVFNEQNYPDDGFEKEFKMHGGMVHHYGSLHPVTAEIRHPGTQYKDATKILKPFGMGIDTLRDPSNSVFHLSTPTGVYERWPSTTGSVAMPHRSDRVVSNPEDHYYDMPAFHIPINDQNRNEIGEKGFPLYGMSDALQKSVFAIRFGADYIRKSPEMFDPNAYRPYDRTPEEIEADRRRAQFAAGQPDGAGDQWGEPDPEEDEEAEPDERDDEEDDEYEDPDPYHGQHGGHYDPYTGMYQEHHWFLPMGQDPYEIKAHHSYDDPGFAYVKPSLVRDAINTNTLRPYEQPFYSNMERVMARESSPGMRVGQVLDLLKARGVSPEEVKFHSLGDQLLDPDNASRKLSDLKHGERSNFVGTEFNSSQRPDNTRLPRVWSHTHPDYAEYAPLGVDNYAAHLIKIHEPGDELNDSGIDHWDDNGKNVAYHVRLGTTGDYIRGIEAQSDWLSDQKKYPEHYSDPHNKMPFGQQWASMALKYMIHHAAANGHAGVIWDPGEHHFARYDVDGGQILNGGVGEMHLSPDDQMFHAKRSDGYIMSNRHEDGSYHGERIGAPQHVIDRFKAEAQPDEHGWRKLPADQVVNSQYDRYRPIWFPDPKDTDNDKHFQPGRMLNGMKNFYGSTDPVTGTIRQNGVWGTEAKKIMKPFGGGEIGIYRDPHNRVGVTPVPHGTIESWMDRFGKMPRVYGDHHQGQHEYEEYPMASPMLTFTGDQAEQIVKRGFSLYGNHDALKKSLIGFTGVAMWHARAVLSTGRLVLVKG